MPISQTGLANWRTSSKPKSTNDEGATQPQNKCQECLDIYRGWGRAEQQSKKNGKLGEPNNDAQTEQS